MYLLFIYNAANEIIQSSNKKEVIEKNKKTFLRLKLENNIQDFTQEELFFIESYENNIIPGVNESFLVKEFKFISNYITKIFVNAINNKNESRIKKIDSFERLLYDYYIAKNQFIAYNPSIEDLSEFENFEFQVLDIISVLKNNS